MTTMQKMTTGMNRQPPRGVQKLNGLLAVVLICLLGPAAMASVRPIVNLPSTTTVEQIQDTLDSMTSGGEVVLAAGTYEVAKPIVLRHDNQTLRGAGAATILRLAAKANCPVIVLGAPKQSITRVTSHLRVADLFIDGNRANQDRELWGSAADGSVLNNNGIDIWSVSDAVVEHVVCCSCRSGGLVAAEAKHIEVRDFTAYDNEFDGLACYYTEDSHFAGLNLHDNLAAGISLDLSFQHNVIENATISGNDLGIFMRDSRDNVFAGVTIESSRNHGVFMAESGIGTEKGWKSDPGTACTNNKFVAPVVSNCGGYGFLINDASCTNNLVSDGRFENDKAGGLFQMAAKAAEAVNLAMP